MTRRSDAARERCRASAPIGGIGEAARWRRLVLRAFRSGDLDAHAAMNADPRVMEHIGEMQDRETAYRSMCSYLGHWWFRR
jgi:RimJ/RimL family protein N-acetyltransferase